MFIAALGSSQEDSDLYFGSVISGGPLGRSPYQGRNWEGPGPDPYLHGENAYYTVAGNQDAGVIATAKHYVSPALVVNAKQPANVVFLRCDNAAGL